MEDVVFALLFMALGGLMVHIAWVHSWRMYKSGKAEGQGLTGSRPIRGIK